MANPLAHHEDRAAHVEAERVVLERRAVAFTHQEADQPFVALVHRVLARTERDACGIDDREVVGHRLVEPDEAIGEYVDAIHVLESSRGPGGCGRGIRSSYCAMRPPSTTSSVPVT